MNHFVFKGAVGAIYVYYLDFVLYYCGHLVVLLIAQGGI